LGTFLEALFRRGIRKAGLILLIGVVAAYGWVALRGPQGVGALLEKHREIRALQEQNAAAAREIERRKERIRRLTESQSEQDMEIRKQLKLLRPGETTFILPDGSKDTAKPDSANPGSNPAPDSRQDPQ
jgi:cell division protein FtsB